MTDYRLAIIILTYNRWQELASLLNSIAAAPTGSQLEIGVHVFVNGPVPPRPTDDSRVDFENVHLYYSREPHPLGKARNLCMSMAKIENYDGVLFLDDDCVLPPDYFTILLNRIHEYDIVSGPNLNPASEPPESFQSKVSLLLGSKWIVGPFWPRFRKAKSSQKFSNCAFMLCNLFVSERVLRQFTFSNQMISGEENDFLTRARKHGFSTFYDENLEVEHHRRPDLKSLLLQNSKYGLGRAEQIFAQSEPAYLLLVLASWTILSIFALIFGQWLLTLLMTYLVFVSFATFIGLRQAGLTLKDLLIIPAIQLGYIWGLVTSPIYISRYGLKQNKALQKYPQGYA